MWAQNISSMWARAAYLSDVSSFYEAVDYGDLVQNLTYYKASYVKKSFISRN